MSRLAFYLVAILLALNCEPLNSAVTSPIISLKQGKIQGKVEESRSGKNYVQYLGIPFAQKPIRFEEAGDPQPWEGLKDGTKFGSSCSQFDRKSKMVLGSEDCLFLNVYTPQQIPRQDPLPGTKTSPSVSTTVSPGGKVSVKRPVIVYIHGGSFVSQSGEQFGAKYILDEDVIFVSFNYRLSVFGFLSTGDKGTVSNLGLRDQILALKWVQENIEVFGGDKNKVTLLGGGSAGGAMASYLMVSPMSKGLFSSVISTSGGSALSPWAVVRNPRKIAVKLATKLNCPSPNTKSSKELIACIKSKGIKDIEIARVSLQGFTEDPAVPFAPVVESWMAKDPSAIIPESPEKLMLEGKYMKVPWLTGVNSLNGVNLAVASIVTTPKRLTQLDQDWYKLAPTTFHYSQTAPNPSNVSEAIREHYFGSKPISVETKDKLISALTDRNFIHGTAQAASLLSKFSPVYLYSFNYVGPYGFLDEWGVRDKLKDLKGAVHGDELQYVFNLKIGEFPYLKLGDQHYPISEKMVKLFASFAKSGKPMEITDKAGAEWSPVPFNQPKAVLQWYNLDSSSSLSRPVVFDENKQSTLWDQLDLGESIKTSKTNSPFTIGYEMKNMQSKTATDKSSLILTPLQASPKPISIGAAAASPSAKPIVTDPYKTKDARPSGPAPVLAPASTPKYYALFPVPASSPNPVSVTQSSTNQISPPPRPLKTATTVSIPAAGIPAYGLYPEDKSASVGLPVKSQPASLGSTEATKDPQVTRKSTTDKPKVVPSPSPAFVEIDLSDGGAGGGVFKDSDPYSSTTTTTKKPGFFSKIIG